MAPPRIRIAVFALFGILPVEACLGAIQPQGDTTGFTLIKSADGIDLYERWYSIAVGKQAREIKAVFRVNAEPAAALALIKDESRGREWNSKTKDYTVLLAGRDRWTCHIEYDFPWPLSNQDCVLLYSEKFGEDSIEICFRAVDHPSFPVHRKVQRIPDIRGKWLFRRIGNSTSAEYFITTRPSDTFPAWLTDPIIRGNLIETLTSFQEILEKGD